MTYYFLIALSKVQTGLQQAVDPYSLPVPVIRFLRPGLPVVACVVIVSGQNNKTLFLIL
jgi:hypothetical protein